MFSKLLCGSDFFEVGFELLGLLVAERLGYHLAATIEFEARNAVDLHVFGVLTAIRFIDVDRHEGQVASLPPGFEPMHDGLHLSADSSPGGPELNKNGLAAGYDLLESVVLERRFVSRLVGCSTEAQTAEEQHDHRCPAQIATSHG